MATTAPENQDPTVINKANNSRKEPLNVFLRVRPLNSFEKGKNASSIVDCPGPKEVVVRPTANNGTAKTFIFDRVFDPTTTQAEVYDVVAAPLLDQIIKGYSCTVFVYGQTGTGKTFTMEGERSQGLPNTMAWETDPLAGIVPRAMSQLFHILRPTASEFTVRVSFLELYNEEVYDLLSPLETDGKPKSLRLYEEPKSKGSVIIKDLEEIIVHSKRDVYGILERGSQMRKTASTLLSAHSSRSHTIFAVTVHIKESNTCGDDLLKIGKLYLVDLAGSENIGRSGAVDKQAREAGNINQSLLTLGRVITALVECQPHVPYRESKLTRLLHDSLGGKTKTSIIATVSPASMNIEETLSILEYAHRAKNIKNRPEVNQKLTKQVLLKEYTDEIQRLRRDLLAAREKNGIYLDKATYDRMIHKLQSQSQDLKEMDKRFQEKDERILELEILLTETRGTSNQLKNEIESLSAAKEEAEHLVAVQSNTETKLKHEAITLLETAKESTADLQKLYLTLDRKKILERSNYEEGGRFQCDMNNNLMSLGSQVDKFIEEHSEFGEVQKLKLAEDCALKEAWYSNVANVLEQQNATMQAHILEQQKTMEAYILEQQKTMQAHMNQVMAAYEQNTFEFTKQLNAAREMDERSTGDLKGDMESHCEAVSSCAEDFKQQLYQQTVKVTEFWNSTYLLDNPSGGTPCKKKGYDYPRNLSSTSPHARILERFRQNKHRMAEDNNNLWELLPKI